MTNQSSPGTEPPICCYCDNDLSCGHCGVEQPYTDISQLKARVKELETALGVAQTLGVPADPDIAALYSALIKANIPFSAYSSNGFNLIGDSKSIKEATAAFHHHAQIDEFRTQIRHWREKCGKLHASPDSSTLHSDPPETATGLNKKFPYNVEGYEL